MSDKNNLKPLRALVVEDVEDDALLLVDHLKKGGFDLSWQRVDTEPDMVAALQQPWDIVFSDFSMPYFSGPQALDVLRRYNSDIPLIFVSGTIGEDTAVEAMRVGAQDYVMKGALKRLLPAVERELQEARLRRERRRAEQTLRQLSLVVKQAADSVFITDPDGVIEYVNPAFEKLTGYEAAEVLGKTPAIISSGQHDRAYYQRLWHTLASGKIFRGTLINQRRNSELFYEEKVITPLKNEQGVITHFVSTGRDITARVLADEERNRLAAILEATPDLVAILEPGGCMRYLNGAGRRLSGLTSDEDISQRRVQDMFPEGVAQQLITEIFPAAQLDGAWHGETSLQLADGSEVPVSQVVLAHRDAAGKIEYLSMIARDISERKRFEAELQHQATHDSLTGLPNRFLLADRCTTMLEHARRNSDCVAVMFLDMDNFKRINDSLGHAAGDALLQQAARRLQSSLRPSDTVARHGGDEFTVVVGELEGVESTLSVLRKIRTAFERPVLVGGQEIYVAFSIGIAIYPHDGDYVELLLRNADTAMYQAKSAGPNQYRFYASDMNVRGHELLSMETDLRRALEHNEFLLYYQPQIDLSTGGIIGVEALIRWQHPREGLVSPEDFIPLLEDTGLIVPVGEWVLRQACAEYRRFREAGFEQLRISVNVSANQFSDEHLLDKVRRALKDESMPTWALELEITENVVMQDPKIAANVLQELHGLGVRLAIDDFGTGYSSLAYLKRFPLDVLKVDQEFVRDVSSDASDAAIVEASISMAQKLGLVVVAEGVETAEQLEFLRSHHCDMAQGYYMSRPLPSAELLELLRAKRCW